jgi:glycosyltransferase involved in cell wall biosynthesis
VRTIHFVLPNDIDDPARPSGGNVYDRRLIGGLAGRGWTVREHAVFGDWPYPDGGARADLAGTLAALPDGALVVLDGLIASAVPEVLAPHRDRLRLVVLMHMPLGQTGGPEVRAREGDALRAAIAVVTMSRWCADLLIDLYDLPADRIHLAAAGVDLAPLAPGTASGARLLCVAAITAHKGHDVLVRALSLIPEVPWTCVCVGTLDREPAFCGELRRQAAQWGIADRLRFPGAHAHTAMEQFYAEADLLVLPTWGETYPLVVGEALAHGTPVVASAVGGLPEALGRAPNGQRPGILVPPGDAPALADALRRWLEDPVLRASLRRSALGRRASLRRWGSTARVFADVLTQVTQPDWAVSRRE